MTDADRLAEALALLRLARPIVEADARMQDDIGRFRVMPYGGDAEAAVNKAADDGYALLGRIDAVLGEEGR